MELNNDGFSLLGDVPVLEDKERPDLLKFASTAHVLADAAVNTTTPLTIGIFGEWGSGKTSLMRLMKKEVEKKENVAAVWFNAWQYEKEEHLIVPLVATINKELDKTWTEEIKTGAKKLSEALRAIAYGFSIKGKVGIPLISEAEINLSGKDMIQRYQDLTKDTVLSRSLYFDAFEQLRKCAEESKAPRIIVFVDDLDRCFPDNAVELLEGIKLVLHQPGFSFVLGVNEVIINAFIKTKYAKDFNIDGVLFEDYLDKIVQVKIPVPTCGSGNMDEYIRSLLRQGEVFAQEIQDDLIVLIAEAGKHNPRSVVRLLNRIMITSRIGAKEGQQQYNPLALLIHIATDENRYTGFREALDITVIMEEGQSSEPEMTIGRYLAEKLENYTGDHGNFISTLRETKLKSREDVLKKVIEILEKNANLCNLLKSDIGREWVKEKDFRRALGEVSKITVGERKTTVNAKDALPSGSDDPIHDLLTNLVKIPGGKFKMGSIENATEQPIHERVLHGFEMSAMPVTQAQYVAVMGSNPSHVQGPEKWNNPVENVHWKDAVEFCKKLSKKTSRTFTLPSEAQWEYACRAGSTGKYCFGDNEAELPEYAWFEKNSQGQTRPAGTLKPNAWGLYDMHGNVWEWCQDSWHKTYDGAPSDDSAWEPHADSIRVLRGGCWDGTAEGCRSSYRRYYDPGFRRNDVGFRVLADLSSIPEGSK